MNFDSYSLRLITPDDLQQYFDLIQNNTTRLEDYFPKTLAKTKTIEEAAGHLAFLIAQQQRKAHFQFLVIEDISNVVVAAIMVKNIDWEGRKAELGYFIDGYYEGNGIMSKSVALIVDFCFTELLLNKVYIRLDPANNSSRRVAEKNAFVLEGILRKDHKKTNGNMVDSMYFGLLNE